MWKRKRICLCVRTKAKRPMLKINKLKHRLHLMEVNLNYSLQRIFNILTQITYSRMLHLSSFYVLYLFLSILQNGHTVSNSIVNYSTDESIFFILLPLIASISLSLHKTKRVMTKRILEEEEKKKW